MKRHFLVDFGLKRNQEKFAGSIANRGSRFVTKFHLLQAAFKFCTRISTFVAGFPFPFPILCYNGSTEG